jgi:predicted nucleic-acid-binding protein
VIGLDTNVVVRYLVQDERVAVTAAGRGAAFADSAITELGRANGCAYTVTFARLAARNRGMRLLGSGQERPDL